MLRRLAVITASRSGQCRSGNLAAPTWGAGFAALLLALSDLTPACAVEAGISKTGNPLWGIPVADLRATTERPLFSPSRRPPSPPLTVPPVVATALPPPRPPEPQPPPLTLLGTIVGEHTRIAVFVDQTTNDIVHLKLGDDRAGWTLRAVHGRQVDFEKDRRGATFSLQRDVEDQRLSKPPIDQAAPNTADQESYRAALHQRRAR
jgi:hypothetical protein